MGFFKRKDPAEQAQASKRAAVPSEVQAAELRGRARRRLAGAVALVLAAVIVLPMVLDSQPAPVDDNIPSRCRNARRRSSRRYPNPRSPLPPDPRRPLPPTRLRCPRLPP